MMPSFRNLEIEPLGGEYFRGQFWPLTQEDARTVEEILGWTLPADFLDFATTYGICRPVEEMDLRMKSSDVEDPNVDVFFGTYRPEPLMYSLVNGAKLFDQDPSMLGFAQATTGMFFMASDGSIAFQRSGYRPLFEAADSFSDFLDRLYPEDE